MWPWLVGSARHSLLYPGRAARSLAPRLGLLLPAWRRLLPWGRRLACRAVVPKQGLVARSWLFLWPSLAQGLQSQSIFGASWIWFVWQRRKANETRGLQGYAAHPPP